MLALLQGHQEKRRSHLPQCYQVLQCQHGGIDKSDMLVHLYRTPMKSKRWYMRLFAYCLDLAVTNAWLSYRRDCKALSETKGLTLKEFRIKLFMFSRKPKPLLRRPRSLSTSPEGSSNSCELPRPIRSHRSPAPHTSVRFDCTLMHTPIYTTRQTCKRCSHKGNIVRSNIVCNVCKVHLCLNAGRNCFLEYHKRVA